jgi:AraC family transcriptional regulator
MSPDPAAAQREGTPRLDGCEAQTVRTRGRLGWPAWNISPRTSLAPGLLTASPFCAASMILLLMKVPEATSAEGLEGYVGGQRLVAGWGEAWRDIKASIFVFPSSGAMSNIPSVSEPVLLWVRSGEAEVQERETNGPWITSRVKKGAFFLTTAGLPYDCHWKTLTPEPLECMLVSVGLPLLERALEEVFGAETIHAQLRDVSGFTDAVLNALLVQLHGELRRRQASPLFVQGLAQAIAVHLARTYAVTVNPLQSGSPSLPGYKLRRIAEWMAEHVAEDFNLARLAAQAGLSKFHFHRLFKRAVGVSPARYHLQLRMAAARRLLRETKRSVGAVGRAVGYANPSHFAQRFRRETGLSPSEYRRPR